MTARGASKRQSPRYPVDLACSLQSDLWDEPVALRVTELARAGLWVESELALEPGEQVVVALGLPDGGPGQAVWALASVARVGFYRRRSEGKRSGMGLALSYVRPGDAERLAAVLSRLPAND